MNSKRCTCAPHPRIDLTDAYFEYHGKTASNDKSSTGNDSSTRSNDDTLDDIRKQIQTACESHGCFHVSIRHPTLSAKNASNLPIGCLAKNYEDIEKDVELLFSPRFLKESLAKDSALEWGDICNHKTLETVFYDGSGDYQRGTFRGRLAESGDEGQCKPEPKLSWEFQRCSSTKQPLNATSPDGSDTFLANQLWRVLPEWTEALHSVAATVIHLHGIPPGLVLREKPCECCQSPTNESPSRTHRKCNIDLLRVFRYDPLDINDSTLGSSAHSDWGTITVVWQDKKGGLQTYCDSCDRWSSVEASASVDTDHASSNDKMSVVVNLFLHVGDFLSLASLQDDSSLPKWHSPRHRVLCPVRSCDESLSDSSEESFFSDQCRCSLVYFAYPPPGISLKDAQSVVCRIVSSPFSDSTCGSLSSNTMNMYSVLHDQSEQVIAVRKKQFHDDDVETVEETTTLSYEQIRDTPFDEVIAAKWNQVQRNPYDLITVLDTAWIPSTVTSRTMTSIMTGLKSQSSSFERLTMPTLSKVLKSDRPLDSALHSEEMSNIQKPVLQVGDAVFSAWWPDIKRKGPATWYPGIITKVKADHAENFGYGPLRLYDIEFDDGDVLDDVWDVFVFPKDEYIVNTSEQKWKGIENVTDQHSEDDWARIVGWYVVSIDGQASKTFSLLSEAIKACSDSTVMRPDDALPPTGAESNSCTSELSTPSKESAESTCLSYKNATSDHKAHTGHDEMGDDDFVGEFSIQRKQLDSRSNCFSKRSSLDVLGLSSSHGEAFVADAVQSTTGTDVLFAASDATDKATSFAYSPGSHWKSATCKNAELYSNIPTTKYYGATNDETYACNAICNDDTCRNRTKKVELSNVLRVGKRMRKRNSKRDKKKICSYSAPTPRPPIDERIRNDALTKNCGPLSNDQDWLKPDYMVSYQRDIESGTESQEPAADDAPNLSKEEQLMGQPAGCSVTMIEEDSDLRTEKYVKESSTSPTSVPHYPTATHNDILYDDLTNYTQASDQRIQSIPGNKKDFVDPMHSADNAITHSRSCLHQSSPIIVNKDATNKEVHSDSHGSHPFSLNWTNINYMHKICDLELREEQSDTPRKAEKTLVSSSSSESTRTLVKIFDGDVRKRSDDCAESNSEDLSDLSLDETALSSSPRPTMSTRTTRTTRQSSETTTQSEYALSIAETAALPFGIKSNETILLQGDQAKNLPFPPGFNILTNLHRDGDVMTYLCGEVVGASFNFISRKLVYQVLLNDRSTSWFDANKLAYAPGSPIYYSPSGIFDENERLSRGEVLLCWTQPLRYEDNLTTAKQMNEALLNESPASAKSTELNSGCKQRIQDILHRLDTEVYVDHSILELTGIKETVRALCKFESEVFAELAISARILMEKWLSQVKNGPEFYYTVMVSKGSGMNEFEVIEGIPSRNIKPRIASG